MPDMPSDKTLDLIQKLHNLATNKGATEAEAENALARMQALLFRHNLSIEDVKMTPEKRQAGLTDVSTNIDSVTSQRFTKFSSRPNEREWITSLASSIARYNFGRIMVSEDRTEIWFVGTPENIEAIKEIWAFAVEQVMNLSGEAYKVFRKEGGKTDPRQYKRNFSNGCVARLHQRLREEWEKLQQAAVESKALIVVNDQALQEYMDARSTKGKAPRRGSSSEGYRAGFAAGDLVQLGAKTRQLS